MRKMHADSLADLVNMVAALAGGVSKFRQTLTNGSPESVNRHFRFAQSPA